MICKNCGINEREGSFGYCTSCLDTPPDPKITEPKRRISHNRAKSRRLWRKYHNAKIPQGWHIHHIDKNVKNNDRDNLVCVSLEQHIRTHELNGDEQAVIILKRNFKAK